MNLNIKELVAQIKNKKQEIIEAWIETQKVSDLLASWGMEKANFKQTYAKDILSHLLLVMSGDEPTGDCPTLEILMQNLASKSVSVGDIFTLCIEMRHAISIVSLRSDQSDSFANVDTMHRFFDANLRGVLDRYYSTLLKKEDELKKLQKKSSDQERMLELQSRQAIMGEMIAAISHQLNQPLNIISLMAFTLEDEIDTPLEKATLEKFLQDLSRQVRYMSSTINDFKNFFKPSYFDDSFMIQDAIDETMRLIGSQYEKQNVHITLASSADRLFAGNKNEFVHLLLILLSNAKDAIIQHKPEHGEIKISLNIDEQKIELLVCDNGGGISDQILSSLFSPYNTSKADGTGIGLYIAKEIARKMNAEISATNIENGAQFCLTIPLDNQKETK